MVNTIELKSSVSGVSYVLSYLERNSEAFKQFDSSTLKTNGTESKNGSAMIFELTSPMYITALKIEIRDNIEGNKSSNVMRNVRSIEMRNESSNVIGNGSSSEVENGSSNVIGNGSSDVLGNGNSNVVENGSSNLIGNENNNAIENGSSKVVENGRSKVDYIINSIVVMGCPNAVFDTGSKDMADLEWTIQRSENKIQTFPYLSVVPESDSEQNILDILNKYKTDSKVFNISGISSACSNSYKQKLIRSYLKDDKNFAAVKFDNVSVLTQSDFVQVVITMTALDDKDLHAAMSYLSSKQVTDAVHSVTCNEKHIHANSSESMNSVNYSPSSETLQLSIGSFVLSAICMVILMIIAAVVIKRCARRSH